MKKKTANQIAAIILNTSLRVMFEEEGVDTSSPAWARQYELRLVLRSKGDRNLLHEENNARTPSEDKEYFSRYVRASRPLVLRSVCELPESVSKEELDQVYEQCTPYVVNKLEGAYSFGHIAACEFIIQNANRPENDKWDAAKEIQDIIAEGKQFLADCLAAVKNCKLSERMKLDA